MGYLLAVFALAAFPLGGVWTESEVERVSKASGMWLIYHGKVKKSQSPPMVGKMRALRWSDAEPRDNHWQWEELDNNLKEVADEGVYTGLLVKSGQSCPDYLYETGATHHVYTNHPGPAGVDGPYPYPFTDQFKMHYKRYVTKVREHIETLPHSIRSKLLFVQAGFGTTDDAIPWNGKPVKASDHVSHEKWQDYQKEMMLHYCQEFKNMNPHIYLLFNQGNGGEDMDNWLSQHCPGAWRKAGNAGHGYQMNHEADEVWLSKSLMEIQHGLPVAARSELSGNSWSAGYWIKAPMMNMFAQLAASADFGLDIECSGNDVIGDKKYFPAFEFFNRYAGAKHTETAVGGFCAFHDGLDTADTHRFPEHKYGPVYKHGHHHKRANPEPNLDRMHAIAKAFHSWGATLNDEHAAVGGAMANRVAKDFNDVGIKIHSGNYERNIHQIDPNETSIGWWRVGDLNTEMYGRFARSFEHSSGKNEMYFQLNKGLWGGLPLKSSLHIKILVAYFDKGNGHFEMHYDGPGHNGDSVLLAVHKTNSGKWKTASKIISDGHFGQRGPKNSDLWLKNTDNENDIFGVVEAYKVDGHGAAIVG